MLTVMRLTNQAPFQLSFGVVILKDCTLARLSSGLRNTGIAGFRYPSATKPHKLRSLFCLTGGLVELSWGMVSSVGGSLGQLSALKVFLISSRSWGEEKQRAEGNFKGS